MRSPATATPLAALTTLATAALVAVALATLTAAQGAGAQTLTFDPDIVAAAEGPARGTTMRDVEARFGAPDSRSGPVGDPPISVWHYARFKVYFEYDRVLHATARRSRTAADG